MKKIAVLRVPADMEEPIQLVTVEADLDTLRGLLDGGWLEGIGGDGWTAYLDEEGRIKGLPVNRRATTLARMLLWGSGEQVVGPVVFLGPVDRNGDETEVPGFVRGAAKLMGHRIVELGELGAES